MTGTITLSTIPLELGGHIISFFDPSVEDDKKSLLSLSQVNHQLCHLSQRTLFHTITLHRPCTVFTGKIPRRISPVQNLYNLITRSGKLETNNSTGSSNLPHPIASYIRRIEIRDDIRLPFYKAKKSWIITDPTAIYLAPLLHPYSIPLGTDSSTEEERHTEVSTPTEPGASGQPQSPGLLPNLDTICIIGNRRGDRLSLLDFRKDMREALALRLSTGTLKGLHLRRVVCPPMDLLRNSRGLEVVRFQNIGLSLFPDVSKLPPASEPYAPSASKLKILGVEVQSLYHKRKTSFLGWIGRQRDIFDLSDLTEFEIAVEKHKASEFEYIEVKEEHAALMDDTTQIVKIARGSLKVLSIHDPQLDLWLVDYSPFANPLEILEWAPQLTRISWKNLGYFGGPEQEPAILMLSRVCGILDTLKGIEREKPLVLELRFNFGYDGLPHGVEDAWEELQQKIKSIQTGSAKPAVMIEFVLDKKG